MPKNMLKNYGRFELLELIYNMRKENLELKQRCEAAEQKVKEIREETDKQLERARIDYEQRIEELRMQGAAKDLQIRMKKIEEQLVLLQRLTTENIDLTDAGLSKDELEQLTGGGQKDAEAGPDRENTVNGAETVDGKTTEG